VQRQILEHCVRGEELRHLLAVVPREVGGQLACDPGHRRRGALADSRLAEVGRKLCWRGAQALGCRDAEVVTVPVVDPPDEFSLRISTTAIPRISWPNCRGVLVKNTTGHHDC
jgi:hypothetical protein